MSRQPAFLWGAATSAHQVEGGNVHNDWWQWERSDRNRPCSGLAADHYHRYPEDFALARKLGHNAHRVSLEWSRIELEPGEWNPKAINHYRDVLKAMKREGLSSFVTLHHFTNPRWFAEKGGWLQPDAPILFNRYVKKVVEELGDLIDYWITINEPMLYAGLSYWQKRWPPQHRSLRETLSVVRRMAQAHQNAYRTIHKLYPGALVGIANHIIDCEPARNFSWMDRVAVKVTDWWFNRYFYRLTLGAHDFLGVNYYAVSRLRGVMQPPFIAQAPQNVTTSDLGWSIRPDGLTKALVGLKRYSLPIYITENGLADKQDTQRADFIRSHLRAIEAAQVHGVDVRGYLHWSLLDNFEWDLGFEPRFGLVAVDYKTMERSPRPSAYAYKAIIEQAKNS